MMSLPITLRPSTADDAQLFYDVIDRTMRSYGEPGEKLL